MVYSWDKRSDLVQVVIGPVMTRDSIPVAHHVFPGNTANVAAFRYAVAELKGQFALRRVVVVADKRMMSKPLLEALDKENADYIVDIPLKKWRATNRVLRRAGRYHEVAENLHVKEVQDNGRMPAGELRS